MTKREICETRPTIAYYSGLGGIEIKEILYGIDEYVYAVLGAWCGQKTYHKVKVKYDSKGNPYFRLHGYKILLAECIRCDLIAEDWHVQCDLADEDWHGCYRL